MRRRRNTRLGLDTRRHVRDLGYAIGLEIRRMREDAGVSQAALARAAGVARSQLAGIEAGRQCASVETLAAIATALGGRLQVRIDPGTGPAIRDRHQARMIEALLRDLHPRWKRFLEVSVHRPVRGVIDLVLHDPDRAVVVAGEAQSQLRRLEQTIRWSNEKASALLSSSALPASFMTDSGGSAPSVSRLLLLRSSAANREIAGVFEETLRAAYPAPAAAVVAALTTVDAPWPGAGTVWVRVDGSQTRLLDGPHRGVALGA